MINICKKHNKKIKRVLEPSCGSCQVINEVDKAFEDIQIDGVEFNNTIFTEIKALEHTNNTNLMNNDYLKYVPEEKYDLIIGNPPYFVMPKKDVESIYYNYFDGRPNIFILFIIKAMFELKMNGILAFVLPKNFLNCNYYNKLREHIVDNFKIVSIKDHSNEKYIETGQDTIVLIIQKRKKRTINIKYVLKFEGNTIFNTKEGIKKLKEYYKDATTLKNMKFEVKVGTVVWNQVKDKLTNDESKTLLIYSGNIQDGKLVVKGFHNEEKKQYIDVDGKLGSVLVVNRGYGNGDYKFNYAVINPGQPYLCENHIIYIVPKQDMTPEALLSQYEKITNSFENEKTKEFIKLYFANNGINTTELQHILPIY